jgi:hypothetical protein
MERREFLATLGAASAALAAKAACATEGPTPVLQHSAPTALRRQPQIVWTIFSRHLQWLTTQDFAHDHPYDTGVLIGHKAQAIGFSAVDLTVRETGFVDPHRVAIKTHLPLMLRGVRSTGVICEQITTNIELADRPIGSLDGKPVFPEDLLRVAHDSGIRLYRWGGFSYNTQSNSVSGRPQPFGHEVVDQLDAFSAKMEPLAALSHKYALTGLYHTYSGGNGPRAVWDLVRILERFSADDLAVNFDIGHMVREGALSAWSTNLRYAMPYLKGIGLKDGMVVRNTDGTVGGRFSPAGTGLVQWREFFQLLLEGGYRGPAQAQYEYDAVGLRGAAFSLNTTFWADHEQFLRGNINAEFMTGELKKDLTFYKAQAALAGWSGSEL